MGQLNNLFISSSYQGLLKMTDSTNGLTNTLQTVQTGDGDNSPLQMSLTEVNISGSFYLNGVQVTGTTSGTSGTSGSSGSDGSSGTSGSSGSSGNGFTVLGEWTGVTTYNINDVVLYNGTSYASIQNGNLNKQPSVQPAWWVIFSAAGSSGTSGTSGSSGSDGSSGTSGSNGSDGSSGTSGTSGSNGSDGTSGTSGSSGNDGLGLPSKVIALDNTGWSWDNVYSRKTITFATPFASSDYVVDFIFNDGNSLDYFDYGASTFVVGYSGKTASGLTLYSSQDITFYTGWTGYVQCIAAGSSNGSGLDGSSGTSGTSGGSGSSGTNGTSGTSGTSPSTVGFITTGSAASRQSITGSLSISEGLIDTGSLINVGDVYILNPAYNSGSVKFNISGSNSVSGSNLIFASSTPPGAGQTGSIVISGSNNILLNATRAATATTYGYIGGNSNVVTNIPVLSNDSLVRPVMSNNQLNQTLNLFFVTSSVLAVPSISNNQIFAATQLSHRSGSVTFGANYINGQFISNANTTTLGLLPQINNNIVLGVGVTLNHASSSIAYLSNVGGGFTVNNNLTSSLSTATNNITVQQNLLNGSNHVLTVTGSNFALRRNFNNNLINGWANIINSDYSSTNMGNLSSTAILGSDLIVSASNATTTGGGALFIGRFNATGSLQESSQDNVFVVGVGTSAGDRKNAVRIDSNSNINLSGSVRISGSLNTTDKINDLKIWTGSANVNSIGIGNNTLSAASGTPLANIAIGNNALKLNITGSNCVAIGGSALENSLQGFNTAIGASALGALVAGEQNMAIGQSAIQALTSGGKNTGIGFNTMVGITSGSFNTAIGAGTLQRNTTGDGCVVIGNQAGSWSTSDNEFFIGNDNYANQDGERSGSMFWGVFNNTTANQTLQINAQTSIKGSLTVTGGINYASGSNTTVGTAVLNGANPGAVTVSNSLVTANSLIFLTKQTLTNAHMVAVSSKGTGTFTITSNGNGDADTVAYQIINPA